MTGRRRLIRLLASAAALSAPASAALSALAPASGLAVAPKTTLTALEPEFMCVVCKTPLSVSQSPQANSERAFISGLLAKGDTKAQIEKAMVFQYGSAVLALPPAHGFDVTLYVLPPAVLIIGAAILVYTLPKWRRRTQAADANRSEMSTAPPAPQESRRLEEELARYGR